MKDAIDKGHNCIFDTGAIGIMLEDSITKDVGNRVIAKLRQLNETVVDVTPSNASSIVDSLNQRTMKANQNAVDRYISIHANAGGGHGTEIYAMSDKGRAIAKPVLDELVKLGYTNRGIKDGSHLYVLKNTNAPAILIELFFVDSQEDCNKYDAEKLANAIVKGLTGQSVPSPKIYPGYVIKYKPDFYDKNTELIQRRLGIIADGYFGNATKGAVTRYQASNGLSADGEVGINTWTKLFS